MILQDFHHNEKNVSISKLNENNFDSILSIRLLKGSELTKHITKVPALLICISGTAIFEDENGFKEDLKNGSLVKIEPFVMHWLKATEDSNLLLMKEVE